MLGKNKSLADLRSLQDWDIRFGLSKAEGVAEVASVGGFVKQYGVVVDPGRLRTLGIPLAKIRDVIRGSNMDVGGRTLELSEHEFMVRGRGYLKGVGDIENIVVKSDGGTPVLLKDVARVELAGDERRGIAELNGDGEAAGGIALQRFGANALTVIDNIKDRIKEIVPSLPEGTEVVPVYDRSELIHRAIATLKSTLFEESLVVALVCIVFLLHVRSALVAILMLPVGILMAFVAMKLLGIGSNIMSLGGIAIAIGAMIDAAIVMIENAHKHLERAPPGKPRTEILVEAAAEVGPALFFSLLIITVSFLPIFTLESQEGRLFGPLAFTKTFAMAAAAILSVTLVPALMIIFVRGRIIPEAKNPLNRALIAIYRPVIRTVLKAKTLTIASAAADPCGVGVAGDAGRQRVHAKPQRGHAALHADDSTGLVGHEISRAAADPGPHHQIVPRGRVGLRQGGPCQTATDPAPLEMFETIINLKPKEEWRPGLTLDGLIEEMDEALQFPGVSNAWTMPIKARIDMLSTGIRTPVGVKVIGNDLTAMEKVAREVETVLKTVPGTSSAYAERVLGGYYLDVIPNRDRLARYGLMVSDVQDVVAMALGAEPDHHHGRGAGTLHGRSPLPARPAVRSAGDRQGRAGIVAEWRRHRAVGRSRRHQAHPRRRPASAPRTPSSPPTSTSTFAAAILAATLPLREKAVDEKVQLPAGTYLVWSGQFEYLRTCRGSITVGCTGDADDHLPVALPQLSAPHGNAHRHAVAAVRAGRRVLADVVARVQPVRRRGGRVHRASRRRRRNRRGDADLSRSRSQGTTGQVLPRRHGHTHAPTSTMRS